MWRLLVVALFAGGGIQGVVIQNPGLDESGNPTFSGWGVPGFTYGVESATNLPGEWSVAGLATTSTSGSWVFTDTGQTNRTELYYRLYHPYPPAQVIMQGFMIGPQWLGRDTNGNSVWETNSTWSVPCPYDPHSIGGAPSSWWYDTVAKTASVLASNGFTALWLPPPSKGNVGTRGPSSNPILQVGGIYDVGYGIFDDYDLGDKLQNGNYQTRYGSREQLNRCVAMLRANGLSVYADLVTNQRNSPNLANPVGPAYQWFQYKDAYGNLNGGRFPKYWPDFHPGTGPPTNHASPSCPQDPNLPATTYPDGSPTGQSESFWGPDLAPVCGEVLDGVNVYCDVELKKWGDWLLKVTGIQGYRLDACSGISWPWLRSFVNYGAMKGKFAVAEIAGAPYNAYQIRDWMQNCLGQAGGNFTVFDQLLEPALQDMCNINNFWMGALQSKFLCWNEKTRSGINAMDPSAGSADPGPWDIYRSVMSVAPNQVVTVVNEVDTDSPLFGNPPRSVGPDRCLLGYAYIMTVGFGMPCVNWKDWSTGAGCCGGRLIDGQNLNHWINNLIWCRSFVTSGGFGRERINGSAHVYGFERTGGTKALVFLNSNQGAAESIALPTSIPNGTVLQDYTGHSFSPVTVASGSVTVTVPANANGRGYLVLAASGKIGSFSPARYNVTQQWEANSDLSIPPASGTRTQVCRVWVDAGQTLTASLTDYNTTNWASDTQLILDIAESSLNNASNTVVATKSFSSSTKGQPLAVTNSSFAPGFYSLYVTGVSFPTSDGPWWFKLENTYTASPTAPAVFDDTGNIYH